MRVKFHTVGKKMKLENLKCIKNYEGVNLWLTE